MTTIEELKNEVDKIKERNTRVELNKAWETSLTRKLLVLVLTYFVVVIFFFVTKLANNVNILTSATGTIYIIFTNYVNAFLEMISNGSLII